MDEEVNLKNPSEAVEEVETLPEEFYNKPLILEKGSWKYIFTSQFKLQMLIDQFQCLRNCTPIPPLAQQQSTDNKLGLMLGEGWVSMQFPGY